MPDVRKNFLQSCRGIAKAKGVRLENNSTFSSRLSSKTLDVFEDDQILIACSKSELLVVAKKNGIFCNGIETTVYCKKSRKKESWGTKSGQPAYIFLYNYVTVTLQS